MGCDGEKLAPNSNTERALSAFLLTFQLRSLQILISPAFATSDDDDGDDEEEEVEEVEEEEEEEKEDESDKSDD
uniref:Uncharacterized protein n=1 Tax=Angiostrongylus cantonensis TaxID=6313 RepID=A0A0K0CUL2_ANGCA